MILQPRPPVEEWLRQISELPDRNDDAQLLAVKAMAAVLTKSPDQKDIQRALWHFEVELSLSRQFDENKVESNRDLINYILDGLPFILNELAVERGRVKKTGEIFTQTEEISNFDLAFPMEPHDEPINFPNAILDYDEGFEFRSELKRGAMIDENTGMDDISRQMNNSFNQLLSIRALSDDHGSINEDHNSLNELISAKADESIDSEFVHTEDDSLNNQPLTIAIPPSKIDGTEGQDQLAKALIEDEGKMHSPTIATPPSKILGTEGQDKMDNILVEDKGEKKETVETPKIDGTGGDVQLKDLVESQGEKEKEIEHINRTEETPEDCPKAEETERERRQTRKPLRYLDELDGYFKTPVKRSAPMKINAKITSSKTPNKKDESMLALDNDKDCLESGETERKRRQSRKPLRYLDELDEYAQTPVKRSTPKKINAKIALSETPMKKKDESMQGLDDEKLTTPCVHKECAAQPKSPRGYITHLTNRHSSSLISEGMYLLCDCGQKITSDNVYVREHTKKCQGLPFTVHKLGDFTIQKSPKAVQKSPKAEDSERKRRRSKTASKSDSEDDSADDSDTPAKRTRMKTRNSERSPSDSAISKTIVAVMKKVEEEVETPQCVLCDNHPPTPSSYMCHLYSQHTSTLIANGIYLMCECGFKVTSRTRPAERHNKKCRGRQFTIHKREEE